MNGEKSEQTSTAKRKLDETSSDNNDGDKRKKKRFMWKNKYVTEAVYNLRLKQQQNFGNRKKSTSESEAAPKKILFGRRIIDLDLWAQNDRCKGCGQILSLANTIEDNRHGLASLLIIRCQECLLENSITTDKTFVAPDGKTMYEINARIALGLLDAGMGWTHLNKLLGVLDMPSFNNHLLKTHEELVGEAVTQVAERSCKTAAALEKRLTLEKFLSIKKSLPEGTPENFLLPSLTENQVKVLLSTIESGAQDFPEDFIISDITDEQKKRILSGDLTAIPSDWPIRIMASYDMGWPTRGTGRDYDSLSGYGALIGVQCGQVLDYDTKNRKCKQCDEGHPCSDHKCKRNAEGSAKSMEPALAADLVAHSTILEEAKLEIGVLVGDEDSSTICAVRQESKHQIIKLSDTNHAAKNVKNMLWSMSKKHPELKKNAIIHLHRCFTYAVSQNKNNKDAMEKTIKQIVDHSFNNHEHCGDWCNFERDKENYDHSTIPGGLKDSALYEDLSKFFNKLAENVEKFVTASSSQPNENLNAMIVSKAPKSRFYGLTASLHYRVALAIASKNLGDRCMIEVLQNLNLSPGSHMNAYVDGRERIAKNRKRKIATVAFKARRNLLKKYRTILRKKKEKVEGPTYKSGMGLLSQSAVGETIEPLQEHHDNNNEISEAHGPPKIIYFDLETTGFGNTAGILQIAAGCNGSYFNKYVTPTTAITPKASEVHGLTSNCGELFYHGKRVETLPLNCVMREFYHFLGSFGKPCLLVAHNCNFDKPRLISAMAKTGMIPAFQKVVMGFSDTLPIFRSLLNRHAQTSQVDLAKEFLTDVSTDEAHNAIEDVQILEKLVEYFKISDNTFIEKKQSIKAFLLDKDKKKRNTILTATTLGPLHNVISKKMCDKLIEASITYDKLIEVFIHDDKPGVIALLSKPVNGKPHVTKDSKTINNIIHFLKSIIDVINVKNTGNIVI